ncbi:MAG: adenosylcobinamide-phosphate synthase CbiB [Peptostreptococcaceae bacterium]|nr:adenosylcobinamide-phosphate synthase CbiB [Peptostreptococcaceae bacterium]
MGKASNEIFWMIFQLPVSMMLAYILDKLLGDPKWFPHPVIYIGKLIAATEKGIRQIAKTKSALKIGGLILWLITVGITFVITLLLVGFSFRANFYLGFFIQTVILWTGIARKSLSDEANKVYECVKNKNLAAARKQIGYLVGRDTTKLKFGEIIRATVETVAENTVDGVTAPLFYAMIGGAPFMMAYKAINTLDSMVGYKNEKYADLGYFSAKIDDIANFIPARLSLIGFIFGSAIKGYAYNDAQKIAVRDRKNHKSPNAGWSEGAMAGALGVQLGGTNVYFGEVVEKPTIGDKLRELEPEDITRSAEIMRKTSDIMLMMYILILVVSAIQRYQIRLW